jgi:hypothetical protein
MAINPFPGSHKDMFSGLFRVEGHRTFLKDVTRRPAKIGRGSLKKNQTLSCRKYLGIIIKNLCEIRIEIAV